MQENPLTISIIGGCGRVGLPFGMTLADAGHTVHLVDTSLDRVASVNAGKVPFIETDADDLLPKLVGKNLSATSSNECVANSDIVVVVVGTPVDEHLNPDPRPVVDCIEDLRPFLGPDHLVVLRSTVHPGVTGYLEHILAEIGCDVAYCPERIAEGFALEEIRTLPQIIGARTDRARYRASELFDGIAAELIHVSPEEAELGKLFNNSWRYIKFAAANQFFMIANNFGLDFSRIHHAITHNYPRAADLPKSGFAAGPCLVKDTAQLTAFNNNDFPLGHASTSVNEGLPLYVVSRIERSHALKNLSVGILGMAFKAGSDDRRSSLSYKLKKILKLKAKRVYTHDPMVADDPELDPLELVLNSSDLLIIATPHPEYADIGFDGPVFDIWNLRGEGTIV